MGSVVKGQPLSMTPLVVVAVAACTKGVPRVLRSEVTPFLVLCDYLVCGAFEVGGVQSSQLY